MVKNTKCVALFCVLKYVHIHPHRSLVYKNKSKPMHGVPNDIYTACA